MTVSNFDFASPSVTLARMISAFLRCLLCLLLLTDGGILADVPPAAGRYDAWAQREAARHDAFPSGKVMAELARRCVAETEPEPAKASADDLLLAWMEAEYVLFQAIEQRLCAEAVQRKFASVEEFLAVAETITNRRKSRAGRSLEEHVAFLLREAGIAHDVQPAIDGKVRPDVLLPGKSAYDDPQHPAEQLVVLGIKTTCKDRWRQVLNEGRRVPVKHLLTLQPALSRAQLTEMKEAKLQLIVPAALHKGYSPPDGCRLLSVHEFLDDMRRRFPR